MFDFQAMLDGMSVQWQKERADTQMTLGELITALEQSPDLEVTNIGRPHSYRGYYCDLAFRPGEVEGTRPASELLAECYKVMGRTLPGYKGGDFLMGESTPIWISDYGGTGVKIMGLNADGTFNIAEDMYD
jgi:hypothetical protein